MPRLKNALLGEESSGSSSLPTAAELSQIKLPQDAYLTESHTTQAALDALQTYLASGRKHEALQLAILRNMWAHALVISSGIGKDSWSNTVQAFMQREFGKSEQDMTGLRVAYSLFTGNIDHACQHSQSSNPILADESL